VDAARSADLTQFCGFPITVTFDAQGTIRLYPDGSERDTVDQHITYTAAISSSSSTTRSSSCSTRVRRSRATRAFQSGSRTRAAGVILKDRGNVAFEPRRQPPVGARPHPSLHATTGDICDALSH
jgi:hypothetical protein